MKRRLIAMLLAMCMVLSLLPAGAVAAEGVPSAVPQPDAAVENVTQTANAAWPDTSCCLELDWVTSASGAPGRYEYTGALVYRRGSWEGSYLVIPGEYMQLPVTAVLENAFENDALLQEAYLNCITIESNAFLNCVNLTTVILGDGVQSIDPTAFEGCTSLQYNVYGGAKYLGTLENPYYALIAPVDRNMTALEIHPDTRIIANEAFANCTSLRSITIPANTRYVGQSAFQGCVALTEVTILGGQIAGSAFADCTALTKVVIAPGVTALYKDAFLGCTALTGLYISDLAAWCDMYIVNATANPLYYAGNLYLNGALVQELVIPDSVTCISAYTFSGARCVNVISIPSSVEEIGTGAFGLMDPWHVLYEGTMEQWDALGYNLSTRMHYQCSGSEGVNAATGSCQLCQSCSHHYVLLSDTSSCTSVGKAGEASYECDRCGHTYTEDMAPHDRWLEANCTQPRRCGCGCGRIDATSESLGGHIWLEATCTMPQTCSRCETTQGGPLPHNWDDPSCTVVKTCMDCGFAVAAGKHYYVDGICQDCPDRCSSGLEYLKWGAYYYVTGSGSCTDTDIIVPSNYEGLIVYKIGYFCGSDTITSITLPDTVGQVVERAFERNTALKTVVLSEGLKELPECAFAECPSLEQVNIPTALNKIGKWAFLDCTSLQQITIPESVVEIGEYAFENCTSLQRVEIPDNVQKMMAGAFKNCTGLQEVILGNSLREIAGSSFEGCTGLKRVSIGTNVEIVEMGAFDGCTALEEVTLPASVRMINWYAFRQCTSLRTVTMMEGVQTIGRDAFRNCTALESLTLPNSLTTIESGAFLSCTGLTQLTFGNGLQTIGTAAFEDCKQLEEIILPTSLRTIEDNAFVHCSKLTRICYDGTLEQWESVTKAQYWTPFYDMQVYCLGQCRAYGHAWIEATCTEVKHCPVCGIFEGEALGHDYQDVVTEPTCEDSGYTYQICTRCQDEIYVEGSHRNPLGHDWVDATCTEDSHCARCGEFGGTQAWGHSEYSYTEPPTCTDPGYTFHGCHSCDDTYITDEVPALGHTPGSGPNCYGPQICEVCKIELQPTLGHDWVDATCDVPKTCARCGLTEGAALGHSYEAAVTAPTCTAEGYTTHTCVRCGDSYVADKVPALGHSYDNGSCTRCGAASTSEGLSYSEVRDDNWNVIAYVVSGIGSCSDTDIVIPATYKNLPVTGIADSAFEGKALTSITIPDSVTTIDEFAFWGCTQLTRVHFGNGVTYIGVCAFDGCSALVEVYFPGSLQIIEERAFADCRSLTEVEFPASVTTIGADAFSRCSGLTNVTIPATVTSLGNDAFAYCTGLTSVNLGTDISDNAFYYCTKLKNVVIQDGVTTIGASAFNSCNQLTAITIPATVTQIGTSAFNSDWKLWHVLYLGTQEQWDSITVNNYNTYLTDATIHYEATGREITDLENQICSICNCPHDYVTETIQPTCTEAGSVRYTCALCGHSYTETIPAPGHNYISETTAPTCTEPGVIVSTCATCGDCYTEAIPATGHSYESVVTAPTCTTSGYTTYTCAVCGDSYIDSEVPATGHNYTTETTAPTCTEPGVIVSTCATCGDGYTEAIPATGHSYESVVTAPTCTAAGYTTYTCAVCGDSYTGNEVPATGHNYGAVVTAPTCVKPGYTTHTCAVCGDSYVDDEVPATGHNWLDATCTMPKTCVTCLLTEGEALGHDFVDGVCTRCGAPDDRFSQGLTYQAYKEGYLVSGMGTCTDTHVKIPAWYEGLPVIGIGAQAFMGKKSITAITIPDGVTLIGYGAFNACTGLTEIVIPEGVTAIYGNTFTSCINLKTITLPSTLTSIAKLAMDTCYQLETIYFNGTILQWEKITKGAYWDDLSGSEVGGYQLICLGNESCAHQWQEATCLRAEYCPLCGSTRGGLGNHHYENGKCRDCGAQRVSEGLEYTLSSDGTSYKVSGIGTCQDANLVIPATYNGLPVTAIGNSAFSYNQKITSLTLPDSVTNIGVLAFAGCSGLQWIDLGKGVTVIQSSAFEYCSSLTEVVIPDSVATIDDGAFGKCTALTDVTIGEGLTSMGSTVFRWCGNLQRLYFNAKAMNDLAGNWQSIFHNAGSDGPGITCYVGTNVQKIPAYLFNGYNTSLRPKLVEVVFAKGSVCASIGASAFMGCRELTAITLPDSVTTIGEGALGNCTALAGVTLSKNLTTLGASVFSGCTALTQIVIPDGVTTIPHRTFDGCTSLTDVTMGANVTIIGEFAFYYCSQLTTISIPDSVHTICSSAFSDCAQLQQIRIPSGVTKIEDNVFYGCTNLSKVELPDTITSIGYYAFAACSSLPSITIPENVTAIGGYAFYECRALTEIHFQATAMPNLPRENATFDNAGVNGDGITIYVSSNVTRLPEYFFYPAKTTEAAKVTQILFAEDGVCESIGAYAFAYAKYLQNATIPDSVKTIGTAAYYGCSALTEIHMGDGVMYIFSNAFKDCSRVTEIHLGANLEHIEDNAFAGCAQLRKISIPEKVQCIEYATFRDCTQLTVVYLPKNIAYIGDSAFANCTNLWHVLYAGTQEEWSEMTIYFDNAAFESAICHFNCKGDEITDMENHGCRICDCVHEYTTQITDPTCTEAGLCVYRCVYCDSGYQQILPATGHNWQDASCTAPETCLNCGKTIGEALSHNYSYVVTIAPTTQTEGLLTGTCANCSGTEEIILPVLGETGYTVTITPHPAEQGKGVITYVWNNTAYGRIVVEQIFVYGDVNGDGSINLMDILLLRQHLANRDLSTNESSVAVELGADANGDGSVDLRDILLLRSYLANRDIDTGESPITLGP